MAAPNIKAINEGMAAGKMAFGIIERVPEIKDFSGAKTLENLKGDIEF